MPVVSDPCGCWWCNRRRPGRPHPAQQAGRWPIVAAIALVAILYRAAAGAVTLADLDETREWHVGRITFQGNQEFWDRQLLAAITTEQRPWYAVWRPRPEFDPVTFETDLERLRRFYESRGYYNVAITYELEPHADADVVDIRIDVEARAPIIVEDVTVSAPGHVPLDTDKPLVDLLPLRRGDQFEEEAYQAGERSLLSYFLNRGYAWATVERRAEIDVRTSMARLSYVVAPGPLCVFGETTVQGADAVDPGLVLRERVYREGEPFSTALLLQTRTALLSLGLFQAVDIGPDESARGETVVPIKIRITEGPARSIKIGVTYNTADEIGGQVEWEHRNWYGGGRRMLISAKGTQFNSFVRAKLVQPQFLAPANTGVLEFRQDVDNESTYLLTGTQFRPRIERRLWRSLSGFIGYRAEYDALSDVNESVITALGSVKRDGVLSGPVAGLVWNRTDNPLNPQEGEILSLGTEQPGGIWGGAFSFWRLVMEGRKYNSIGWETVLATRLRLGLSDALGAAENLPLFERFYAGGERSVRGYARRQLGPLSSTGKPLGGLSLIEGSLELRRPIYKIVGGVVFVDFGQVSLNAYDIPIGSLEFSSGPGITVDTPVGPLALFVGFPIDPPAGERGWQIAFSVGQFF
jgi:outer membrane protein insertion porin family